MLEFYYILFSIFFFFELYWVLFIKNALVFRLKYYNYISRMRNESENSKEIFNENPNLALQYSLYSLLSLMFLVILGIGAFLPNNGILISFYLLVEYPISVFFINKMFYNPYMKNGEMNKDKYRLLMVVEWINSLFGLSFATLVLVNHYKFQIDFTEKIMTICHNLFNSMLNFL